MQRTSITSRATAVALLALAGGAGIYVSVRAGGVSAGLFAAVALACAVGLLLRTELGDAADAVSVGAALDGVLLALPGALVVYFSFDAGGYFPASPAFAAILLVLVLVVRITLIDEPFAGVSRRSAVAAAAFGLFAVWILASALWSDASARSLIEFDRAFMYLLVLVLFGSLVRTSNRLRWLAGGLVLGTLVVAAAALATRLAPDRFPTSIPAIGESNLAYPLTYSNALGIVCVLGAILALYFATSTRQPLIVRVLGAAALPVYAATVYLTLSRGPVAAAIVGIVAFVVLGRPRGLLTGLLAAVPPSVIAVASAYHHPLLTSKTPQTAAAATAGHRVAVVIALCVAGAAVLRVLLSPLDARLARFSLPPSRRRPVLALAWAGLVVAVLAIALAVDAPSKLSDQYNRFVDSGQAGPTADVRQSVFSSANRGLIDNWSVALDAFKDAPIGGQGAGTYETWWNTHRPADQSSYAVTDAHSLYVEVLGELGLVGFALLAIVIASLLIALAPIRRGPNRALYAALFATVLAWAVHAGVDWDWEMPAVTAGVLALGAAGLAAHERDIVPGWAPQSVRVTLGILLLATAVTPALVIGSQRRLNDARDALRAGNCARAVDRAAASISTLSDRPEPYEVLGLCQAKAGRPGFAVQALRHAAELDPDNWRYHYELAAVQGGAGIDPRPELQTAHRLNPHDPELNTLLKSIPAGSSAAWDLDLTAPSGASTGLTG